MPAKVNHFSLDRQIARVFPNSLKTIQCMLAQLFTTHKLTANGIEVDII
jgi:hypothetical protein